MKKYTKTNPVFSEEIMITETGDPGHADNINAGPKQLLENTLANREEIREGDSKEREVTFTSGDDAAADQWTDVEKIVSGEKHKSLFGKISTMIKNVRFLYNVLGSEDLSEIGDGTVTGILAALKSHCFVEPVNSLLANITGRSLDAVQGAVIQGEIDDIQADITQINSDLANIQSMYVREITDDLNTFYKAERVMFGCILGTLETYKDLHLPAPGRYTVISIGSFAGRGSQLIIEVYTAYGSSSSGDTYVRSVHDYNWSGWRSANLT